MHRRVIGLLLVFTLLLAPSVLADEAQPASPEGEAAAVAEETPAALYLNGSPLEDVPSFDDGGVTYVCLRLMAAALRGDAAYAWEEDRVVIRGEGFVLSARWDDLYLECNGRYLYIPGGVRHDENGDTFVPVRTLARALGAQVEWDGAVRLTTGEASAPLASGDSFYPAGDVDLLARVIYHESGNQPFQGQIAVGNVILNRVNHPNFPGSVSDVIYAPGQFPGATSYAPDAEAVVAAKLCLDGAVVLDDAYWFNGAGIPCWASKNKPLVAVIGDHAFYGL